MRCLSLLRCSAAVLVALVAVVPGVGQTFAASTGAEAVIGTPGARATHVSVRGHHRKAEEKLLYGRVRDGVYTVDGMVAKVQLNYDVNGAGYLYLFVPGVGTAVVSAVADPDAVITEASYKDTDLSFSVGDHRFNLTGVTLASDKGTAPAHLYVKLDRSAWRLDRHPMIGFGNSPALPYVWPGALKPETARETEDPQIVPPVPASLLPSSKALMPAASSAASPVLLPVSMN